MDETIPDVGFSIIGNIHICITTNILTILKVSSFLCVLATKMVYATNGTHLRHVHTEKPVTLTLTVHDLVFSKYYTFHSLISMVL